MSDSSDCVAVTQLWNTSRKISSCHVTTSNEIPAKHFQELSTNMLCQTQRKIQIIISNKHYDYLPTININTTSFAEFMRKVCINSVFKNYNNSRNSQHPRDREQPMGIKAHSSQTKLRQNRIFSQKYTNKIVPTQILFPIITLPHSTDKNSDPCHFVNTRPAPVKPDTTRANWCRLNQRWRPHTDAILSPLQQQNLEFLLVPNVAGCMGINNYTLVNVLPSCTETEHSQQEVLTLTQMSSPVTTDTDATQHPDTTRPGNASKRADSAHKQPNRTSSPTRLHLSPLSTFQRRITRLTTQRELRTPRVPATQQQWQPASQLEARARSRDVPTATYVTHYGAHSLNPKTRALPLWNPNWWASLQSLIPRSRLTSR